MAQMFHILKLLWLVKELSFSVNIETTFVPLKVLFIFIKLPLYLIFNSCGAQCNASCWKMCLGNIVSGLRISQNTFNIRKIMENQGSTSWRAFAIRLCVWQDLLFAWKLENLKRIMLMACYLSQGASRYRLLMKPWSNYS